MCPGSLSYWGDLRARSSLVEGSQRLLRLSVKGRRVLSSRAIDLHLAAGPGAARKRLLWVLPRSDLPKPWRQSKHLVEN